MTVEARPTRLRNLHPVADAEPTTPWGQPVLRYAAFLLMGAEMYLVAPMLPDIAESLHASVAATATIVTAYVLVYAVAGPPFGILADRYPRRWSILLGSLVFMLGNLACAVAGSLTMLVVGRGITGLGGGGGGGRGRGGAAPPPPPPPPRGGVGRPPLRVHPLSGPPPAPHRPVSDADPPAHECTLARISAG
ncbi:MFS transporter, partial [Nocardia brasiliensis]|uniref:MFS transporter n=1 Tax=Nocardia brasiliensis TaxID=37326 RepID=UPI002457D87D